VACLRLKHDLVQDVDLLLGRYFHSLKSPLKVIHIYQQGHPQSTVTPSDTEYAAKISQRKYVAVGMNFYLYRRYNQDYNYGDAVHEMGFESTVVFSYMVGIFTPNYWYAKQLGVEMGENGENGGDRKEEKGGKGRVLSGHFMHHLSPVPGTHYPCSRAVNTGSVYRALEGSHHCLSRR